MRFLLALPVAGAALLASCTGRAEVPAATVVYPDGRVGHVYPGSSARDRSKAVDPPTPGKALEVVGIVLTGVGGINTLLGIAYFSVYGRDTVEGPAIPRPRP